MPRVLLVQKGPNVLALGEGVAWRLQLGRIIPVIISVEIVSLGLIPGLQGIDDAHLNGDIQLPIIRQGRLPVHLLEEIMEQHVQQCTLFDGVGVGLAQHKGGLTALSRPGKH